MNAFKRPACQRNALRESAPNVQVRGWVWFLGFAQIVVAKYPMIANGVELILVRCLLDLEPMAVFVRFPKDSY